MLRESGKDEGEAINGGKTSKSDRKALKDVKKVFEIDEDA